jgi:hypothetical protein
MTHVAADAATHSPSPNPYLFIVGCPRSGTTLLQRIMDSHSQIAITPETHWIPSYLRKFTRRSPDGAVTARFVSRLLRYHRFSDMGLGRDGLERIPYRRERFGYSRFVSAIFDCYGQAHDKPLVGDKTPGYARSIPLLHALWPAAKFVHLLRDGRDVCLSAIDWKKPGKLLARSPTWKADPATTAALWWDWHVRLGRQEGMPLGPESYLEVRYEALVAHPADEISRLCAFLGIAFEEAMLRFHEGRTKTDPELDSKDAWLPITPGLRDWRSQMAAEAVERFEAAAGDLLGELGYSRSFPNPSADAVEHVERIRSLSWDVQPSGGTSASFVHGAVSK